MECTSMVFDDAICLQSGTLSACRDKQKHEYRICDSLRYNMYIQC